MYSEVTYPKEEIRSSQIAVTHIIIILSVRQNFHRCAVCSTYTCVFYTALISTMFSNIYLPVFITSITLATVRSGKIGIIAKIVDSEYKPIENLEKNVYYVDEEPSKKIDIKVYYESFCLGCQFFDSFELRATAEKLGPYLDIHLYPYGNANTTTNENGELSFDCQHGPGECYGNMLHACAIDYLQNMTKAVFFNSCMMDFFQQGKGSDDAAADRCGKAMNIDTKEIKECAKGPKGKTLLQYYGEESKKAGFEHVPYVVVNGKESDIFNFIFDVCEAFEVPPPPCMPKQLKYFNS